MVRKFRIFQFLAILAAAAFLNCETIVEVDLPEHQPALVVNGFFSPADGWIVFLSHSVAALSNDFPKEVTGANMEIFEDSAHIATLGELQNGVYFSGIPAPRPGVEYTLRASAPGFETVTASSKLPEIVPIKSVQIESVAGEYGGKRVNLTVQFEDAEDRKDYYEVFLLGERSDGSTHILGLKSKDLAITQNNPDVDLGEEQEFFGISAMFEDAIVNGKTYDLQISGELFDDETHITVMLSHVDETIFRHLRTAEFQDINDDNPFSEPSRIFQNVQNGYGVFGGINTAAFRVSVP